jgi:hypothetical protein
MANQYRENYINSVLEEEENGRYIHPDRINKALEYLDDAERILNVKINRTINKAKKEMAAENKKLDAELALVGDDISEGVTTTVAE